MTGHYVDPRPTGSPGAQMGGEESHPMPCQQLLTFTALVRQPLPAFAAAPLSSTAPACPQHCPGVSPPQAVSPRPAPAGPGLTGPSSGRTSRPAASSFNSTLFD